MGVSSISSHFVGMGGGLLMSVIAFSIVFLVIVGLMLVMMGIKVLTRAIEATTAAKAAPQAQQASAAKPVSTSGGAAHIAPAPAMAVSEDGELVAVITAAISAICGAGARIVSFAPTPALAHGTPWRMTGRLQNSEGFAD